MQRDEREQRGRAGRGLVTVGLALAVSTLAWGGPAAAARAPRAGDRAGRLRVGGRTRTYLVHVPPGAHTGMPAVLAFHGGGGTGAGMARITHLSDVADQQGFIAVYPQGYANSWAGGKGDTPADAAGIDDVAFVSALIDRLAVEDGIDTTRVFATGLSSGGFMSQRLGCQLSGEIAGIAPVAATLLVNLAPTCTPSRPMPVLEIQGTADPLVPYGGGHVRGRGPGGYPALSAPDTAAHWAGVNGCSPTPQTQRPPPRVADGTTVRTDTYGRCAGAPVVLYTVVGGGHTWSGGEQYLPVRIVGRTSRQFDTSQTMWQFFNALRPRT
jgi:polyhydroxybutyrate depolymerase